MSAGLFVSCLIFPAAGEQVGQSFRAVSVEKEPCSDGSVVDYDLSGRVSGCCGWYLSFTTSAATHTGYDLKMCVLFPAVASRMPGDDNPY